MTATHRASAAVNEQRRKAVRRALAELPDVLVFNDGQLRHLVRALSGTNGDTPPVVVDDHVSSAARPV